MNKRQAKAQRESWQKALNEKRVIKIGETTFKEFATNAIARDALAMLLATGFDAFIVGENE